MQCEHHDNREGDEDDFPEELEEDFEIHMCEHVLGNQIMDALDNIVNRTEVEEPPNPRRDALRNLSRLFIEDVECNNLEAAEALIPMLQIFNQDNKPWAINVFKLLHKTCNRWSVERKNKLHRANLCKFAQIFQDYLVGFYSRDF